MTLVALTYLVLLAVVVAALAAAPGHKVEGWSWAIAVLGCLSCGVALALAVLL